MPLGEHVCERPAYWILGVSAERLDQPQNTHVLQAR